MRFRVVLRFAFAFSVLAAALAQFAEARSFTRGHEGLANISHIVFIVQENRSYDNYFGTYPGANGFPSPLPCLPSKWYPSKCYSPFLDHKANQIGGPYSSSYQLMDIDGGKMDGFEIAREREWKNSNCNPFGNGNVRGLRLPPASFVDDDDEVGPQLAKCTDDVMSYHDGTDIPNYWAYAQNFVLSDNFFESVHSQSHPAHLELFSGWAAKCKTLNPPDVNSCASDANPGQIWGPRFPVPYLWTDITYLLYQNSVDWKVYLDGGLGPLHDHATVGALWDVLPGFETVNQDGQVGNAENYLLSDFFSDAAAGTLPPVSWVLPHYNDSEHPQASIYDGQAYTTSLVNALMSGAGWNSTAIFIVWDDMGGFYDHVPPPFNFDVLGLGIRTPALIISPWSKTNYVDHQLCSTDCYLKFIEDTFLGGERMSQAGRPIRGRIIGTSSLTMATWPTTSISRARHVGRSSCRRIRCRSCVDLTPSGGHPIIDSGPTFSHQRTVRMSLRLAFLCTAVLAGSLLAMPRAVSGSGLWTAPAAPRAVTARQDGIPLQKLKHLIFIVQENRSFDHYFGTFPGVDGYPSPLPCLPSHWYPSKCFTPYPNHKDNQAGGPYSVGYQRQTSITA